MILRFVLFIFILFSASCSTSRQEIILTDNSLREVASEKGDFSCSEFLLNLIRKTSQPPQSTAHAYDEYIKEQVRKSKGAPSRELREIVSRLNEDIISRNARRGDVAGIGNYTRNFYKNVNNALRSGSLDKILKEDRLICKIEGIINKLFISSAVSSSILVYRGHSYLPHGADQVGYEFVDKAYVSTSIYAKTANQFTKDQETRVIDVIDFSPEKVKGFWMHPFSDVPDEFEILLERNLRFKVVAVEKKESFFSKPYIQRTLKVIGKEATPSEIVEALNCDPDDY